MTQQLHLILQQILIVDNITNKPVCKKTYWFKFYIKVYFANEEVGLYVLLQLAKFLFYYDSRCYEQDTYL